MSVIWLFLTILSAMAWNYSRFKEQVLLSGFVGNLGKLMSGTGFAHLLGIAVLPVLTRLYTPDEIGVYATFLSLLLICYCAASLRYEFATLIPRSQSAANNITMLAISLAMLTGMLLLIVLLLFRPFIAEVLNIQALGRLVYLLPLSVVSFSIFMILTFSLNRQKKYGTIAAGKITSSSSTAVFQIGMGLQQLQQAGLVLGKVLGDFLGMIFLLWQRQKLRSSILAGVSPRRMVVMARRYSNFPIYNTPHALTTSISNNFPVLLFNSWFSEAIAGFYAMAHKALYSPVQVIGQAAYQVFSQRISEKYGNQDKLIPFVKSTLLLLAAIGILPFLLLFWVSPPLFSWFLGPGWEMTGYFVRILTPFVFLVFIVTPLNFIPLLLGRQKKAFLIDVTFMLSRLMALVAGIYQDNIWLALSLYSAVGVLFSIYLLIWYYSLAKAAEKYV